MGRYAVLTTCIITASIVFPLSACATSDNSENDVASVQSNTTATPWSYPPAVFTTEIAAALDPVGDEAARFAMQYEIDAAPARSDPDLARSVLTRVVPELTESTWPGDVDLAEVTGPPNPYTGGETLKAVAVSVIDDQGTLEVTVCRYLTPGIYTRNPSTGELFPGFGHTDPPYYAERPRVRFTTDTSADGSRPDQPRWLVVGGNRQFTMSELDRVREICGPHAPDPFVRVTPTPVAIPDPGS